MMTLAVMKVKSGTSLKAGTHNAILLAYHAISGKYPFSLQLRQHVCIGYGHPISDELIMLEKSGLDVKSVPSKVLKADTFISLEQHIWQVTSNILE